MYVIASHDPDLIEAWFDGACEPRNPGGTASYGVLIKQHGVVLLERNGIVGKGYGMTNNVAEYEGLNCLLRFLINSKLTGNILICGDSKLVIMQMSGKWKVKKGLYIDYCKRAKLLSAEASKLLKIQYKWIPREQNEHCDALSKSFQLTA
jgi:ribonuclease HI